MNKNQEDNLKRQLKELRRKNKELQEGLDQIRGSVDAILIRLGQTFGEDREDGWRIWRNTRSERCGTTGPGLS